MRITVVIEPGRTPLVQAVVRDHATGQPTSVATVVCTFVDASDVPVVGQAWPVTLVYVPGTPGLYRATLSPDAAFVVGQTYKALFDITVATVTRSYTYDVDAVAPGGYDSGQVARDITHTSAQRRLCEAQEAYHQLIMGKAIATVKDQNGEEMSYSLTNRVALAQYIAMLQREVGQCGPLGPATVTFEERGFRRRFPWTFGS